MFLWFLTLNIVPVLVKAETTESTSVTTPFNSGSTAADQVTKDTTTRTTTERETHGWTSATPDTTGTTESTLSTTESDLSCTTSDDCDYLVNSGWYGTSSSRWFCDEGWCEPCGAKITDQDCRDECSNVECSNECFYVCIDEPLTQIEWTMDDAPYSDGPVRFTAFDKTGKEIWKEEYDVEYDDEDYVWNTNFQFRGETDKITFNTNTNDGVRIKNIKVKIQHHDTTSSNIWEDGIRRNFVCIDCMYDSPSIQLGSLYLDKDMNGPLDVIGQANCKSSCTFVRYRGDFPIACIKTVHEDFLMPRQPSFHDVTFKQCHEKCSSLNHRYFSLECPHDATVGNYITICFCYDDIPFDLVEIPMGNCFGSPGAEVYGWAGHGACKSDEDVYVDADGHGLGGWGRATVYDATEPIKDTTTYVETTSEWPSTTTDTTEEHELPCNSTTDCDSGWMCNFDDVESGSCENCENFPFVSDCYDTNFITTFGTEECINACTPGSLIRVSWTIKNQNWVLDDGTFGFTAIDNNGDTLYRREPSHLSESGHVEFDGNIRQILVDTNTDDGIHFDIEVTKDALQLSFVCIDCLPHSPSIELGTLYLDGDMNGPTVLMDTANCNSTCTFVVVRQELPVACIKTVHDDHLMPRQPGFHGVTFDECQQKCSSLNHRYFSLECPHEATVGNYITTCFCYEEIPFDLVEIPLKNCFGYPQTDIYGSGGHGACKSDDDVYVDADGNGLGGWGRATVYEITDSEPTTTVTTSTDFYHTSTVTESDDWEMTGGPCITSADCDHEWFCDFDDYDSGSCESCGFLFELAEDCYDTSVYVNGIRTREGVLECVKVCEGPQTRITWTTEPVPVNHWTLIELQQGTFGFTAIGKYGRTLYRRNPKLVYLPGHAEFRGHLDHIIFDTNDNDGVYLHIKVTKDEKHQNFECKDCLGSSTSIQLGLLHLDGDMDGPLKLPDTSNCRKSCTFFSGTTVSRDKLHSTIPTLYKEWSLSVDIQPTGLKRGWSNVLHVGFDDDHPTYGDRTDGIWFHSESTKLRISGAINANRNYEINTDAIPMNEWTHVNITQFKNTNHKYEFTISIDGEVVHQMINKHPETFDDVKVYTSDDNYPAALARIDHLQIVQKERGFAVSQGHLYETIPVLYKQWYLSFDLKLPDAWDYSDYFGNIIQVGRGGKWEKYGDRTPAIFLMTRNRLKFQSSINGDNSDQFITKSLDAETWIRVEISQVKMHVGATGLDLHWTSSKGAFLYSIKINGEILHEAVNLHAQDFEDVKVYASNKHTHPASARIDNLLLKTFPDNVEVRKNTRKQIGGCKSEATANDEHVDMKCMRECGMTTVGRKDAIKFKWVLTTTRSLIAKITVKTNKIGWPEPGEPYIGILRLDRAHGCSYDLLLALSNNGEIRLDVGDESDPNHTLESISYIRGIGEKWGRSGLFIQFRRGRELGQTKMDQLLIALNIFQGEKDFTFYRVPMQECLSNAHLSILPDDGAEPFVNDYTRCAAYSRYGKEITWAENDFRPIEAHLEVKSDSYVGGCKPHWNPDRLNGNMICKRDCEMVNVGQEAKVKFKWTMQTERNLVAELTLAAEGDVPNAVDPYVGIIRLTREHCGHELLLEIAKNDNIRFDVGDRYLHLPTYNKRKPGYLLESITYPYNVGQDGGIRRKAVLIIQFRKFLHRPHENIDETVDYSDQFFISLSEYTGRRFSKYSNLKTCLEKAHLSVIHDEEEKATTDYSRCAAYSFYDVTPNWTEQQFL